CTASASVLDTVRWIYVEVALADSPSQHRTNSRKALLDRCGREHHAAPVSLWSTPQRLLVGADVRLGNRAHGEVTTEYLLQALPRHGPVVPRLRWWLSLGTPAIEQDGERWIILCRLEPIRVALTSV